MGIEHIITLINKYLTLLVVFPAMMVLGGYLTYRLKFVQIFKLKSGFTHLLQKNDSSEGNISHFEAIAAVLAGNFGTGNISGMAVAITTGGPGALVWMWLMAFLGAAIQYASCILAVKFRTKNSQGEYVGGPMYYLRDGLRQKTLGILFACFTLFAAVTVGNFAQINSVTLPLQQLGCDSLISSLVIAAFVGMVILGGVTRLAGFASYIVPLKAALYLGTAAIIICLHLDKVLPAFHLMWASAFDLKSATGGILGFAMFKALTTGFDRGIFATDAGTGIVPILQASARTKHPVIDGIVTLVAPLMVMIVCTTTGLVLIITGAFDKGYVSTNMVTYAFSTGLGSSAGTYIVITALILFAYTTILAWAYCGEKALGFLIGSEKARYFRYVYLCVIPLGALINVHTVWTLADIAITLMLIINMIGVAGLSSQVIEETRAFDSQNLALAKG